MIIRMAKVEIVGPKDRLLPVLDLLRGKGVFQPDPQLLDERLETITEPPKALVLDEDELRERTVFENLRERIRELLDLLPEVPGREAVLRPLPAMDLLTVMVDRHLEDARSAREQLVQFRAELEELERDLVFWETLDPLLEQSPPDGGLQLFGVTIRDPRQLHALEEQLQLQTRGRCQVSSRMAGDGTLVGLIVTDRGMAEILREALSRERVPELSLPGTLADLPLPERSGALRDEIVRVQMLCDEQLRRLNGLARQWRPVYLRAMAWLDERIALYRASAAAYATRQCFIIQGWMAADDVADLRDLLARECDEQVVIEQQQILFEDLGRVPVMLHNPTYFQPFERFARLLPLPKYTSYDPTPFIGLFFPLLFGMILGDIGYGLVLLSGALLLVRRLPAGGLANDLGKVLGVAAVYTVLFGLLFGELFGDLGETWLGLHPVWVDRSKAILPMIIFAITVGVVHVLLGLGLGVWSDLRQRHRREAVVKLVSLLAVILTALLVVGWFAPVPWLATGPLLAGVAILVPVLVMAGGLLAPLELLKTLGNIISYVRIMAIGLCSVLLAVVANQLGGMTGDVLVGVLVAGILHAFNLLLGVFAPTVHALRLHYVEFFSKFLDLGGRRFEPWHRNAP